MRYLLLIFLSFSASFADLQSKIYSSAQDVCYLKNPTNGFQSTDYDPSVTSQTLRHAYESTHTQTQSSATCEDWELNPYVNVDTETYQVIADMDCTVNQETDEYGTTYYWTVTNQYALNIDCNINAGCEIPKDSSGVNYESAYGVDESGCTVSNLQSLLDSNDPNNGYIINDAQYLNCPSNSNYTGCYYKKHINSPDNNSFGSGDDTTQNSSNSDYSDILKQINIDLLSMKELMTTDREESEVSDSLESSSEVVEDGISRITASLNSIVDLFTDDQVSYFNEESGDSTFSTSIYGGTFTIDLSFFEKVRIPLEIFWTLLLAYINIKIYWFMIRDLLKKL